MPTARDHSRWLIPTFAVLTVAGLVLLVLAIAAQFWLIVGAAGLGVLGNALGLWNQIYIRRSARAGDGHVD